MTITLLNGYNRIHSLPIIQYHGVVEMGCLFFLELEKKRNYNSEMINYSRNKQKREYETDKTLVKRECLFILCCMSKSDTVMLIIMRVSHCGIQRDYTGTCGDEII